jgi:hypothetical protein
MIKAVLRDGLIHPTESLPPGWKDGKELLVQEAEIAPPQTSAEITRWREEIDAAAAELDDAAEWEALEATLAEADRQAKDFVRRQMGLP